MVPGCGWWSPPSLRHAGRFPPHGAGQLISLRNLVASATRWSPARDEWMVFRIPLQRLILKSQWKPKEVPWGKRQHTSTFSLCPLSPASTPPLPPTHPPLHHHPPPISFFTSSAATRFSRLHNSFSLSYVRHHPESWEQALFWWQPVVIFQWQTLKKKKDSLFGVCWGSARGDPGNSWVYQILSYPFSSHQVRTDKCGKFSTQGPSVLWVENVLEATCFCGSCLAETRSLAGAVVGCGALCLALRKGPECRLEVLLTGRHTGVLLGCTQEWIIGFLFPSVLSRFCSWMERLCSLSATGSRCWKEQVRVGTERVCL